jgi:hypothetical protein
MKERDIMGTNLDEYKKRIKIRHKESRPEFCLVSEKLILIYRARTFIDALKYNIIIVVENL